MPRSIRWRSRAKLAALRRGAGGFAGAYDDIPDLAAVFGMRRMLSSYTGSLIRLRRSSDNAEQDIGYVANGDLDTDAAATFIGGGSGYIATLYEQMNGNDATQATAASQPLYVASGQNSRPVMRFDGSDDALTMSSAVDIAPGAVLAVAKHNNTSLGQLLSHSTANRQFRYQANATTAEITGATTLGTPTVAGDTSVFHILLAHITATTAQLAINGAYGTETSHAEATWTVDQLGRRGLSGEPLSGDIAELPIASAAWSTANREAAFSAANSYWSVY